MYKQNQTDQKSETLSQKDKESSEKSLDKVLEAIKNEAHGYKNAGMTHISSLLA
ncbi:MAG: hypothetical protein KUG78_17830 [Kangiellaceae bacterium]|nr:hypothetical protein [Kangiellaceae bacterium]